MFELSLEGIARSVGKHNSRLEVFCDWLEGSIIFHDKEISKSDIVDVLMEGEIYTKQDFANEWVDSVWSELRKREDCLQGGAPFIINSNRVERRVDWKDNAAHSFCLVLSLAQYYSDINKRWTKKFSGGFQEQGELFELLTEESMKRQFENWSLYRTGWSRTQPRKLNGIVDEIVRRLGEEKGNVQRWTSPDANEEGLDLLFYKPFSDNRVGIPVYLMQCSSGANWKEKLKTPDMAIWTAIIHFASPPGKAFATPLSFCDQDFIRYTKKSEGLFIDRYRILFPSSRNQDWISNDLKKRIIKWVRPRLKTFPTII